MEFPFGHHHNKHNRRQEDEDEYPPPPPRPQVRQPYDYPPPNYVDGGRPFQPPPPQGGYDGEGRRTEIYNDPEYQRPPQSDYGYSQPPPPQSEYGYSQPPPPQSGYGYSQPPPPSESDYGYPSVQHVSHDPGYPSEESRPEHHHRPHFPSFPHRHHTDEYDGGSGGGGSGTNNQRTVRVYTKAEPNYSLTVRDGHVILAQSNPDDEFQHWIKDEQFSTKVKDEQSYPSFALINKATGQALKHSIGATHPVRLIPYNPEYLDESILWTESNDLGDGYRTIRMVNNIRLNLDALNGDKNHGGVHDGTTIVLWEWAKGENQRWKIIPY